jgi:RsiW-degrading membrane proteinase PrsW (M82 family)
MIQTKGNKSSTPHSLDVYSIIQIVLVGLCAAFLLMIAVILIVLGVIKMQSDAHFEIALNPVFYAGLLLLFLDLNLVKFLFCKLSPIHRHSVLIGYQRSRGFVKILPFSLLILWGMVLFVGRFIDWSGGYSSLAVPMLSIFAVILPLVFYLSQNPLTTSFSRSSRFWGSISTGTILPPFISGFIEICFLVLLLISIMIFKVRDPSFTTSLDLTLLRLSNAGSNPEIANHLLIAILRDPVVQPLLFLCLAGLTPVIEEAFKQIPVWLLAWRKLTPLEGFRIGAYSGMGFALTEGLLNALSIENYRQFLMEIILRSAAGLIHIAAGAIFGWGLASAITDRKYLRGLFSYIAAITIHGIWNGLAIWESTSRVMRGVLEPNWQYYRTDGIQALLLIVFFIIMFCFWIFSKKLLVER